MIEPNGYTAWLHEYGNTVAYNERVVMIDFKPLPADELDCEWLEGRSPA